MGVVEGWEVEGGIGGRREGEVRGRRGGEVSSVDLVEVVRFRGICCHQGMFVSLGWRLLVGF